MALSLVPIVDSSRLAEQGAGVRPLLHVRTTSGAIPAECIQDSGCVLRRLFLPYEVICVDDNQVAVRQASVQIFGVREWDHRVVAPVDDGHGQLDGGEQLAEDGQLGWIL